MQESTIPQNATYPVTKLANVNQFSNTVLNQLIELVKPVDFLALLQQEGGGSLSDLKQKHYLVCINQEVLRIANEHNLGLCQRHEFIYAYNGQYWQQIERNELRTFLGVAAINMGYNPIEAKYFEFRDKLLKQFISIANLPEPVIDDRKVLINLVNGTLEVINTGRPVLREHRQEDFLTYQLPFAYNPDAQCPLFESYLLKVQPDKGCQKILLEFVGYSLTKGLKLEKCLLLYGEGANGKSVFFDIVTALEGRQNISSMSLGNLKEEHNRALIANKLLNYGSEINEGTINADIVKQLISGEPVQARMKYGNPFMMENYAKLAFNCNTLPQGVEQSEAFYRRFLIVPFDVIIPEAERDPNLATAIIANELSGIFNLVLQGLERLLHNRRFTDSQKVAAIQARYRIDSDSVASFIEDKGMKPSTDRYKSLEDLYTEYKVTCVCDGCRPVTKKHFAARLRKLGYEITRRSMGFIVFIEYKDIPNFQ